MSSFAIVQVKFRRNCMSVLFTTICQCQPASTSIFCLTLNSYIARLCLPIRLSRQSCLPGIFVPTTAVRGWNFKKLFRNKLRFTWGWAEGSVHGSYCSNIEQWGLTWALLSVAIMCISSYSQRMRASFLQSIQPSVMWYTDENETA
jgi:hypothetical protein